MFNLIKNIKDLVGIAAVVSTMLFGYLNYQQKQEIERVNNNLYAKTIQWEDEKGRLVTETTELRFTNSELKHIAKQDSTKMNKVEKQLLEANRTIKDLGIKLKDAEEYNSSKVETDTVIVTQLVFDKNKALQSIKPIVTPNLQINFKVKDDKLIVDHKYKAKLHTVVYRKPRMETINGKRRFFMARWINPDYSYWTATVSDDPNATITETTSINFQRGKGKR